MFSRHYFLLFLMTLSIMNSLFQTIIYLREFDTDYRLLLSLFNTHEA